MKTGNSVEKAALGYLDRGWSVIPVNPSSKKPLLKTWLQYQNRKATESEVKAWWAQWPGAGIGLVTGTISGIIVLDVDGPEGKESIKNRHIEATVRAKTKSGGEHYYFKHPGGELSNFAGKLPGIDARADGGYVLAPPTKGYEWTIGPDAAGLGDPPSWFLELFEKTRKRQLSVDWQDDLMASDWTAGGRNDTLTRMVGRWVAQGMTPTEVRTMAQSINLAKCKPPLDETEVDKIVESIYATHTRRTNMVEADTQDAALAQLSDAFGFKITAIIKYVTTKPTFQIFIDGTTEPVNVKSEQLLSQVRLAPLIFDRTNLALPTFDRKRWTQVKNLISQAITEVDMGEEGTEAGITRIMLADYLASCDIVDSTNWMDNSEEVPFKKDGIIYVPLAGLREYMAKRGQPLAPQELATRLKGLGAVSEQVSVNASTGRMRKRGWRMPGQLNIVRASEDDE